MFWKILYGQYLKSNIGQYYQASLVIAKLEFEYRRIFKRLNID